MGMGDFRQLIARIGKIIAPRDADPLGAIRPHTPLAASLSACGQAYQNREAKTLRRGSGILECRPIAITQNADQRRFAGVCHDRRNCHGLRCRGLRYRNGRRIIRYAAAIGPHPEAPNRSARRNHKRRYRCRYDWPTAPAPCAPNGHAR
jgi:hypothetical protein